MKGSIAPSNNERATCSSKDRACSSTFFLTTTKGVDISDSSQLNSGQTLLIPHDIDIASRILGLQTGDEVAFRGQNEWNPEGGVIHWTRHDPDGQHADGWLKLYGQLSE